MKTIIVFLFILFTVKIQAQDNNIKLVPENGKEYIYRYTDTEYIANESGKRFREFRKQKNILIRFSDVESEGKELLQVKVTSNKAAHPLETPKAVIDYQYPYFEGGYYRWSQKDFYEELLCDIEFLYEFNSQTSNVEIYNRSEVLLEVREVLKKKKFDKEKIDFYTREFNKVGINEITSRLNSVFCIPQSFKEITSNKNLQTQISVKDSVTNISAKKLNREVGLNELNVVYDQKEQYLKYYHLIKADSTNMDFWHRQQPSMLNYYEKEIELLKIKDVGTKTFTISGKIEGASFKKFTLAALQKPFGLGLTQRGVYINRDSTFHIEMELNHPGIVLLQVGRSGFDAKMEYLMLYAEPGGSLELNSNANGFPDEIEFKGDLVIENQMLNEFKKMYDITSSLHLNVVEYNIAKISFSEFEKALDKFDSFIEDYKDKLDLFSYEFITRELKAQLYSGAFTYLRHVWFYKFTNFGYFHFPEYENVNVEKLEKLVAGCDILENYNDYGIYSRLLLFNFVSDKMNQARQLKPIYISGINNRFSLFDYRKRSDFPLVAELAKIILSGHAYYSYVAGVIQGEYSNSQYKKEEDSKYLNAKLEEYTNQMLRLCNNSEFSQAIKETRSGYLKWEDEEYVPSHKFFNIKGEEVRLVSFLGEKPTVFYVNNNWGTERYHFDDLATENDDINFVMIVEGNNFEEWCDYQKRAEPVAKQVLLINSKLTLKDIFKNNLKHFIVYNKAGARFGFADSPDEATKLAKQSLKPPKKKELNKSQLQTIILVLLAILTALIIGLLIWKWRVRQRFRKEEQNRKLKELELTAIRSQMNPHFLFNSLNSVQNLVQQNKGREAHLYLSDFAGLIRKVLNNSEKEEVSLAEELEMIKQYLSLERLRFDFEYALNIDPEIDLHNTMVPSMLLQPFVENAIVHGLQNKTGNRQLTINISKEPTMRLAHIRGSSIKINIEDNGIGREEANVLSKQKNGKGTKLMNDRLKLLEEKQGEKYDLRVVDLEQGTRVEIRLPEE